MTKKVTRETAVGMLRAGEYLLPAEVALLIRVDPKTVSRWAAEGKVPARRTLGGHYRFSPRVVNEMLLGRTDWSTYKEEG